MPGTLSGVPDVEDGGMTAGLEDAGNLTQRLLALRGTQEAFAAGGRVGSPRCHSAMFQKRLRLSGGAAVDADAGRLAPPARAHSWATKARPSSTASTGGYSARHRNAMFGARRRRRRTPSTPNEIRAEVGLWERVHRLVLCWQWAVEGVRPTSGNVLGGGVAMVGAGIIVFAVRSYVESARHMSVP